MGMKFLNKKGWHTGSIRNIETVWKAEQKRAAEDLKIEELRKQIKEEREKAEFRQLQVEAGLVPRQERLDFLYDSGLSVGKPSSADGFKELEALPTAPPLASSSTSKPQASNPGALFEEKPQSANDAWRKLNSDPLLLIRKREQEALARIKNNPIQMAMIKESVGGKKKHDDKESKKKKKKSKHCSSKGSLSTKDDAATSKGEERGEKSHRRDSGRPDNLSSDSEGDTYERKDRNRKSYHRSTRNRSDAEPDSPEREERNRTSYHRSTRNRSDAEPDSPERRDRRNYHKSTHNRSDSEPDSTERGERDRRSYHKSARNRSDLEPDSTDREERNRRSYHKSTHNRSDSEPDSTERGERDRRSYHKSTLNRSDLEPDSTDRGERKSRTYHGSTHSESELSRKRSNHDHSSFKNNEKSYTETIRATNDRPAIEEDLRSKSRPKHRQTAVKLTEEEKAAKLREMQMDAEVHEEQRWKRLKKAAEDDALEEKRAAIRKEATFLDEARKSAYGSGKGGSTTIEESVRRRKFFMQGQSAAGGETNAFRR
ncbi:pre-mRNA-splicing factor CWC25 homolog [Papaver somniferum]|uniref:pre-mRNA-splicing factor CWC25 homolog n=1 Tax=Papaver somniferum TaxID=3469 RepID=UPI000E6FB1D3|nr:pre-mRNA-splicing factor CWC25 homolog [Papaver somniferum]